MLTVMLFMPCGFTDETEFLFSACTDQPYSLPLRAPHCNITDFYFSKKSRDKTQSLYMVINTVTKKLKYVPSDKSTSVFFQLNE